MSEYKLLLKRDYWMLKNHVVEVKHNPKRLIVYLLYVVWIGSLVVNAVIQTRINNGLGRLKTTVGPQIIGAGFTVLMATLLFYYLYKGTEESSTFFSMGDVNLLFPSPKSSKKILLYQMLKNSLLQFFVLGFLMVAFLPTIIQMTALDFQYVGYMYLGYLGIALLIGPLNFMIFALGTKYNIQLLLKRIIFGLIYLSITYIIGYIFYEGSFFQGLLKALNAEFVDYIPIIGWSRTAFMVPIRGYSNYGLLSIFLLFLTIATAIILCYHTADDYYEDVLGSTEKQALRRRIKKGIEKTQGKTFFLNKNKQVMVHKTGAGPWTLLWRAKVEYSRTDLHPYLSILTMVFLLVGLIGGYFAKKYMGTLNPLYFINGLTAYMLFIFSSIQARNNELMKPYIFLIPGKPLEKIIAANFIEVIRMGISAFVLNISLGWMVRAPFHITIIMSIFLISFFILNQSSNWVIRAVFPSVVDQRALFPLFVMVQILFLLLPGMVFGGIAAFVFKNPMTFFLGVVTANGVIIFGMLMLSNVIFERMEWR